MATPVVSPRVKAPIQDTRGRVFFTVRTFDVPIKTAGGWVKTLAPARFRGTLSGLPVLFK
ncbi:hypothetical protein Dda_5787 [Drechslerella dactyloides]|uniref:Uncharacterized protein n=1 Tax=Drechslerella dactyloides TaxID=74499 RepID=A0AAD6NI05_DREDA|nr:hypothetical protein Dda_5787 [Drechslerella dactyloides]